MTDHIFRSTDQPATRYKVRLDMPSGPEYMTFTNRRLKRLHCHTCKQVRIAGNLTAHVYYDAIYFFCKVGKGCKAR